MEISHVPHLFLSYAHKDQDLVTEFHARLENLTGCYVWIDKGALKGGDEWEAAIDLAINESYGVLFFVTQAFLESDFIQEKEIPVALNRFRKELKTQPRLFPIRFHEVDLPNAIAGIQWIDAVDRGFDDVIAELKSLLPDPIETGHRFIVDWPRLSNFRGREKLLQDLHDSLKNRGNKVSIKTAGLYGLGGIGKTQLAVEYAHRYRFHYPSGVYWINAAEDWTFEFASLAEHLALKPPDINAPDRERQLVIAFHEYLRQQSTDALLILDNVRNPEDIIEQEIGPKLRIIDLRAKILITTRRQSLPEDFLPLSVDVLPIEEARQILLAVRPLSVTDNAIDQICHDLGCLPLALNLAAAALRKRPTLSPRKFRDYLQKLGIDEVASQIKLEHRDLKVPVYADHAVSVALGWHWEQLDNENARHLLVLAASYNEAAQIPLARLKILANMQDSPDDLFQPFDDAVKEVQSLNLIEMIGAESIRLHPLIRDEIRKRNASHAEVFLNGAVHLVQTYHTPQLVQEETIKRGFQALVADLRETHTSLSSQYDELESLMHVFSEEAYHLREWEPHNPIKTPYLIQHLRERAHYLGNEIVRDKYDRWLSRFIHFRTDFPWTILVENQFEATDCGHTAAIRSLDILAEKQCVVTASDDKTIRLWDVTDGETIAVFDGHTDRVYSVAAHSQTNRLLSASDDRTLRLWDLETSSTVIIMHGHQDWINAVVILPSGQQAVSAAWDNTLRLWDLETGKTIRTFQGHEKAVFDVAILPECDKILSASADYTLRLWDIETGHTLRVFAGHKMLIHCLVVLPNGQQALSGSYDKTLRLWDLNTGDTIRIFRGHTGPIRSVAVSKSGLHALSGSWDSTLRLWDVATGKTIRVLKGHTGAVNSLAIFPDGERALSGAEDGTIRLWNLAEGKTTRVFKSNVCRVMSIVALSDNRRFVSASTNGSLTIWDLKTAEILGALQDPETSIQALDVLPTKNRIISASSDATLKIWDVESINLLTVLKGHEDSVTTVEVLPDEKHALSGSWDNTLRLWDLHTGNTVKVFNGHTDWVWCVASLSDGQKALSGSSDGTLRLWDLKTTETLRVFEGHNWTVNSVKILPNQKQFISSSWDCTLRLWDIDTGKTLQTLTYHKDWVWSFVILNNGKWVLSASDDRELHLWDIQENQTLAVLKLREACTYLYRLGERQVVIGNNAGNIRSIQIFMPK